MRATWLARLAPRGRSYCTAAPLVEFADVSVRLLRGDPSRLAVSGLTWAVRPGETWAVLGGNGSGKTTLLAAAAGGHGVVAGESRRRHVSPITVSCADETRVVREQLREDELRQVVAGTLPAEGADTSAELMPAADLPPALAGKALFQLSAGELRRALLRDRLSDAVRRVGGARGGEGRLLLLDEPFDGLDAAAVRKWAVRLGDTLRAAQNCAALLTTHRADELRALSPVLTHVLHLSNVRGSAPLFTGTYDQWLQWDSGRPRAAAAPPPPDTLVGSAAPPPHVSVRGLDVPGALRQVDWEVLPGEHWAVVGGNGAGKTTLLDCVAGVHPKGDAAVSVRFGASEPPVACRRAMIGRVSSRLQQQYYPWQQRRITALEAVASGFAGSIGLWQRPTAAQLDAARLWLQWCGLGDVAGAALADLSQGQQRLCLLCRAMCPRPPLLLLDEPTVGLDSAMRDQVLAALAGIMSARSATVVIVSHQREDIDKLPQLTHMLRLGGGQREYCGPISADALDRWCSQ